MKKKKKRKTVKKAKRKKVVKRPKRKARIGKRPAKRKKTSRAIKKSAMARAQAQTGVSLEEIGEVTHYFPRVEAAVVKLTKGTLALGDRIIIKGHTTDFEEKVDSIQLDHAPITTASIGQEIGLKVKSKVREHDVVYKIVG